MTKRNAIGALARGVCAAGLSAALVPATALAGTVKYDLNGPAGVVHEHTEDGDVAVESVTADFDGLGDITGWNTKADGTGTAYKEGDEVSGDATLYAQYSDGTRLATEDSETDGSDSGPGGGKTDGGAETDTPTSFAGLALGDAASAGKLAALSSDRLASLESAVKQYAGTTTGGTVTVQSATDDEVTLTITVGDGSTKATFKHNSNDGWSISDTESGNTDNKTTPDSGDASTDGAVDSDGTSGSGSKTDEGAAGDGSAVSVTTSDAGQSGDANANGSGASATTGDGSSGTMAATTSSSMPSTGYARAALGLIPAGVAAAAAGGALTWRSARKKKAAASSDEQTTPVEGDEDDGVYVAED